jgi:hypothetical protein
MYAHGVTYPQICEERAVEENGHTQCKANSTAESRGNARMPPIANSRKETQAQPQQHNHTISKQLTAINCCNKANNQTTS